MTLNEVTDLCATESQNTSIHVYIKLLSLYNIIYDTGLNNTSILEEKSIYIKFRKL